MSRLPNGLSIVISEGGIAGIARATFTNRDNIGPYLDLGSYIVKKHHDQKMGAPVHYLGKDIDLQINVDTGPREDGAIYSHIYADLQGRVFNEPMECRFVR